MRRPHYRLEQRWQALIRADRRGILARREQELVRLRAELATLHHQVALGAVAREATLHPQPTTKERRVRDNVVTLGARTLRADGQRRRVFARPGGAPSCVVSA